MGGGEGVGATVYVAGISRGIATIRSNHPSAAAGEYRVWSQIAPAVSSIYSAPRPSAGRSADVVDNIADDAAIVRLVGMIPAEQHHKWQVGRRYFSVESLGKRNAT